MDIARKLKKKKVVEYEEDGDTNRDWRTSNASQRLGKGTDRIRNQRKNRDHPDYRIIAIDRNTEKSSEDLRRLSIIQTPQKDHQHLLVGKTHFKFFNNNNDNNNKRF